ncbi:hypothetical protein PGTUg99_018489 [Puccinia graminis f. sp. tritici]|uniref:Uncharacterized protein n=1 Tax=Puccinia graminis f. sp. tritici TaxID=56615 RepID=A0A5B0QGN5_PUCGR|nr:hypothetical protein PGTUg99_018489 [Puccinia graminis f. sp. tritici]
MGVLRLGEKTTRYPGANGYPGPLGPSLTQSQPSGPDVNPPFNSEDYENVCGYLEEEANYTRLYGDGSKTTVGTTKVTKAAAYDIFAIYINDNSNRRLHLTRSQLRQRVDGYKKHFMKAKEWAENTGAGIEEGDNLPTLAELLEKKCPCYERMYGIFGGKANVSALAQHDSGLGSNLYPDPQDEGDVVDRSNSPEVFFSGWEATQDYPATGLTTPATDLEDDELPPPLNFSGTAMDPSPSLMTQRSLAQANQGGQGLPETPMSQMCWPFPNQVSGVASPAPHRESNPWGKTSLASAFESSNSDKLSYLRQHMDWEKEKENKRLEWEKERYQKDLDGASSAAEAQLKLVEMKLGAAQNLLKEGHSPAEVEALLKIIYG